MGSTGLARFGQALAQELTASPCAGSWLGRIEARVKVAGVLLLIVASTFLHSLGALMAMLGVILALALSVRMHARSLARVWLGVPVFSLAIILPAATNLVTPGSVALTLWSFGHTVRIWRMDSAAEYHGNRRRDCGGGQVPAEVNRLRYPLLSADSDN